MNPLLPKNWQEQFRPHAPNELQMVPLANIAPSNMNSRLFIERESLESLERRYEAWADGKNPGEVLPDAPTVRYNGPTKPLELLAGHRRIQAANNAGVTALYVRSVEMDDETAYRFIREANNYEILTTVERAYAIAEMDRLGFTAEQIRETMGNIGLSRYLLVGRLVHPDWFTDIDKLCDPSITVWGYAARHGVDHFRHCFEHWDQGHWDEEDCSREFRRAGVARPPEPYQAGAIMSVDESGQILRFRGTLDLNNVRDIDRLKDKLEDFILDLKVAVTLARHRKTFGVKRKNQYITD